MQQLKEEEKEEQFSSEIFRQAETEMNQNVLERERSIHGKFLGILTGYSCFDFGPPGTGKTFSSEYFQRIFYNAYRQFFQLLKKCLRNALPSLRLCHAKMDYVGLHFPTSGSI